MKKCNVEKSDNGGFIVTVEVINNSYYTPQVNMATAKHVFANLDSLLVWLKENFNGQV